MRVTSEIPAQPWQSHMGSHGCLRSVLTGAPQGCWGGECPWFQFPQEDPVPCLREPQDFTQSWSLGSPDIQYLTLNMLLERDKYGCTLTCQCFKVELLTMRNKPHLYSGVITREFIFFFHSHPTPMTRSPVRQLQPWFTG